VSQAHCTPPVTLLRTIGSLRARPRSVQDRISRHPASWMLPPCHTNERLWGVLRSNPPPHMGTRVGRGHHVQVPKVDVSGGSDRERDLHKLRSLIHYTPTLTYTFTAHNTSHRCAFPCTLMSIHMPTSMSIHVARVQPRSLDVSARASHLREYALPRLFGVPLLTHSLTYSLAHSLINSLTQTHSAERWLALRPPLLFHARSLVCAVRIGTLRYTYIHITPSWACAHILLPLICSFRVQPASMREVISSWIRLVAPQSSLAACVLVQSETHYIPKWAQHLAGSVWF
jgi:hypothetical protein